MSINSKKLNYFEYALILATPLIPLFFTYPYRINVFVAWEGAFRLAQGEMPYRDFGMPVGYAFWIIPALFFKLFGPGVFTLIKAQAFINIISNLSFSRILRLLGVGSEIRIMGLMVYVLSYTLFNFWPWYNHSVFVYELLTLWTLLLSFRNSHKTGSYLQVLLASLFASLTFFTKQDTGALTLILAFILIGFHSITNRKYIPLLLFPSGVILCLSFLIVPFLNYDFAYWFNYGQSPHNSRVNLFDLINEFLGASKWIKFYLLAFSIIFIHHFKMITATSTSRQLVLITLFVLLQASIIQVTSYTPIDGNIYFHAFAITFIAQYALRNTPLNASPYIFILLLIGLWWSNVYWTRFGRTRLERMIQSQQKEAISKNTFLTQEKESDLMSRSSWRLSEYKTLANIKLPTGTIEGIRKLKELPEMAGVGPPSVLNMTELTFLTVELGYPLEKGPDHPLWYHQGVSFFDREVKMYCQKIQRMEYDIILFEDIKELNNFFSYDVRDCIKANYRLSFSFVAPRIPETSRIEVYVKSGPK